MINETTERLHMNSSRSAARGELSPKRKYLHNIIIHTQINQ